MRCLSGRWMCLLLVVLLCAACAGWDADPREGECGDVETGMLLFVRDTAGMGAAIEAATGSFTHVVILEHADSGVYAWEALPRRGVVRRNVDSCGDDWTIGSDRTVLARLVVPFDTSALLRNLQDRLGLPYDDYFLSDNGRVYCSELVEECFYDLDGRRLFEAAPMNFMAADGTLPAYWRRWFDSLGVEVPQGVPGTNPTDLSHSEKLKLTTTR